MLTRTLFVVTMLLFACNQHTHAEYFAGAVRTYNPGTGASLTDPSVALGKPGAVVPGFPPPYYSAAEPLNPFASHFSGDELVQIGPGGQLILRLERYVNVGAGAELGIFGNTAIIDNGGDTAGNPAGQFGNDEVVIEVSETGLPGEWVALNNGSRVAIDSPANFYSDATGLTGPTENTADLLPLLTGLTEADFGLPFDGSGGLSAFDGLTIGQIETLLGGSAGGDWFDLDGLTVGGQPLTKVGFVRFTDPNDPGLFGTANLFELMAVSINSSLAGAKIPEPSSAVLLLGLTLSVLSLRR